ncbi:hypothetical protein ACSU64_05635 [Bacillaceae bacterium C204]|uniref:hypothetical protein n=1 Tax=Neobacillus sp. 204 TaxID=3383351 RepID=UPI003978D448
MKASRIGKVNTNNYGSEMVIEEYHSAMDVIVMFDTGNLVRTTYERFKNGSVRNPYDPTVCEVGFIGEGIHKASKNGKLTRAYVTWNSMLNRAYSKKYHDRNPSYKDVTVCREWWNFQNFAEWFYNNYYKVDNEPMSIDKDILVKGNKIYSPDTCVFVPERINSLVVKCNGSRGKLPVGVTFNKGNNKYQAQCANGKGEVIPLGHFDTSEEAFFIYKECKENVIKEVADEYKGKIPERLHLTLINWKIEIDD